jgi:4-diphosphocytidyl-2-C-methyl-D-erythritol kinase
VLLGGRGLTIRARAKVNLGLEILGRRVDGYHEILSVLWAVDLADRVTLEATRGGITLACDGPGVPSTSDNLAWRAAELLRRTTGVPAGVSIRLDKAIPVAAGLGGGSADAAAVLAGLDRLWGLGLGPERLRALATELGMDVPFFLGRSPALATGRGEVLQEIPVAGSLWLVLVNPGFPLATRDVYQAVAPEDFGPPHRVRALLRALADGPAAVAAGLSNGLEPVVARLWPGLESVKAALRRAGTLGAVMSGSGPTVIGVAPSRRAALAVKAALAGHAWGVWVTRTVSGPPLSLAGADPSGSGLGRGQAARRGTLDPVFGGSNPPAPTNRSAGRRPRPEAPGVRWR